MATHSLLELTLFVIDVDESAAFYRTIGIQLFDDDQPSRPHLVDGQIGKTGPVLQLFPAGNRPVTRVQLGFVVTDVAAVAAELTRLGIEYEIPGVRRLRTTDPNGNRVHLTDVIS
ncbi:VOC family protein [Mycobacterium colombiense]